jgi:nucleoid-associated protein YgaU
MCELMTLHFTVCGVKYRRPGIALFCLLAPVSLHTRIAAQDVAEAADQQQAQKSQQPAKPHHVYTDEELKRARILTPEDRNRAEARKQKPGAAPSEQATSPAQAEPALSPESLGEIARRYRKEKAALEGELAATRKSPSSPRIELPSSALAEPKRSIAPAHVPSGISTPSLVAPPVPLSRRAGPAVRISPFQPRRTPVLPPGASPPVSPSERAPSREFRQVQVQSGDSLWRMARRYLGEASRWQEFLALNPGLAENPDFLAAGTTVIVPAGAPSRAAPIAHPTITIQPGDTLWSLARLHYGHGSAWRRLAQANPQISDYLHLRVGSLLQLPLP